MLMCGCGCEVRPHQIGRAHTCACASKSGSAMCVRATQKTVATHTLIIIWMTPYNALIFFLGSGKSRKRKRRKEALQHLAANDCRQSIGELRDLSMGNSINGSLLDDHTTPVKKGSASNLLQVKKMLEYCFGRENSKFKFRKLRDLSMGNFIDGSHSILIRQ